MLNAALEVKEVVVMVVNEAGSDGDGEITAKLNLYSFCLQF